MKKKLLTVVLISLINFGWGQIIEFTSSQIPDGIELRFAESPEFIQGDNKLYFRGSEPNLGSSEIIYSINQSNQITREFDANILGPNNKIDALTWYNGQLYFALGTSSEKIVHVINNFGSLSVVEDLELYGETMKVWDGNLYFTGRKLGSTDWKLYGYNSETFTEFTVIGASGFDFKFENFAVSNTDNRLYFFLKTSIQGEYEMWCLENNNGSIQFSILDTWINGSFSPAFAEFNSKIYLIGQKKGETNTSLFLVENKSTTTVNNLIDHNSNSFYDVSFPNSGIRNSNNLAIIGGFNREEIRLFSPSGTINSFRLPQDITVTGFLDFEGDGLIFTGQGPNGITKMYEFRIPVVEGVHALVREIHQYLPDNQGFSSFFGKSYNGLLWFYSKSNRDFSRRTLHRYNPKILNAEPILNTQEQVNYFGSLGYEEIVGSSFTIQESIQNGNGTPITELSPLSTIMKIPSTLIIDTQLGSLSGLENISEVGFMEITNNGQLQDYCALTNWVNSANGNQNNYVTNGNAYNPTFSEIQNPATCSAACTPLSFTDANLKAFLVDPNNSNKILDNAGAPVTGLVVNGEVCQERADQVYEIDLQGGYMDTAINSLEGIEQFTNLKNLLMSDSKLTGALDLSAFQNLEIFEGQNNRITSVSTSSPQNNGLRVLQLAGQGANSDLLLAINIKGELPSLETLGASQNTNLTSVDITKTPKLNFLRVDDTGVTFLDLTQIDDLDNFDTNYFTDDQDDGALQQLDLRNNRGNFNVASFELDATGHPNLNCVLVNQGDLAQAQANVAANPPVWRFNNADIVGTQCPTCTPLNFADANLRAFLIDPASANRILDNGGAPVTGLVVNGEVCQERANQVYEIDLNGGYKNTPIASLGGLEQFANLRTLNINLAQLSGDIDLRPLTALEVFNAEENDMASVTASSTNTVLRRISIFAQGSANNTLTAVNLNGTMPALKNLDVSFNANLTAIDLTRTPLLDTFQSFGTAITRLDFTALQSAGSGNFFISESGGGGALTEIDVRNGNPSFDIASFELDATGHPNLNCVLVNQGDLAQAQANVAANPPVWRFNNADIVKTDCNTSIIATFDFKYQAQQVNGQFIAVQELGGEEFELYLEIPNLEANTTVDFDYEIIELGATNGQDFSYQGALNGKITYDERFRNQAIIQFDQLDDNLLEPDERFILRISNPSNNRVQIANAVNGVLEYEIVIEDDERATVALTANDVTEGGGDALVIASLVDTNGNPINSGYTQPLDFLVAVNNGTATKGEDFQDFGGAAEIFIQPGKSSGNLSIDIVDDNAQEPTENFSVEVIDTPNNSNISIDNRSLVTIQIFDNDAPNDTDQDGVADNVDNCPNTTNADQADNDNDDLGDVCDPDDDNDGVPDTEDPFPLDASESKDTDGDGTGDNADTDDDDDGIPDSEEIANGSDPLDADTDNDGVNDGEDAFPNDSTETTDTDQDGVGDESDNCPTIANTNQQDSDNDGIGDVCDEDNGNDSFSFPVLSIQTLSATCPGEENGVIDISGSNFDGKLFDLEIIGSNYNATEVLSSSNPRVQFIDLPEGGYDIKLILQEDTSITQNFFANIVAYEEIDVASLDVNSFTKQVILEVSGSKRYTAMVNGNVRTFNFSSSGKNTISLSLSNGSNKVVVEGESQCQGYFEDTIIIGDIKVFPNPVKDILNLEGLTEGSLIIQAFDLSGSLVFTEESENMAATYLTDFSVLPQGTYIIRLSINGEEYQFKIIKE